MSLERAIKKEFSGKMEDIMLALIMEPIAYYALQVCQGDGVVVVSHIQRTGYQPEKTTLRDVANPARDLLNRENATKREDLAAHPPPTLLYQYQ